MVRSFKSVEVLGIGGISAIPKVTGGWSRMILGLA